MGWSPDSERAYVSLDGRGGRRRGFSASGAIKSVADAAADRLTQSASSPRLLTRISENLDGTARGKNLLAESPVTKRAAKAARASKFGALQMCVPVILSNLHFITMRGKNSGARHTARVGTESDGGVGRDEGERRATERRRERRRGLASSLILAQRLSRWFRQKTLATHQLDGQS